MNGTFFLQSANPTKHAARSPKLVTVVPQAGARSRARTPVLKGTVFGLPLQITPRATAPSQRVGECSP